MLWVLVFWTANCVVVPYFDVSKEDSAFILMGCKVRDVLTVEDEGATFSRNIGMC